MGDDDGCDRDDRTIFVGGLPDKATEALLYELFFQAGKKKFTFFISLQLNPQF